MDTKTAIERNEGRTRHRLREAAGASWLPWLTGRAIVLAALALARYEVSHLHIQDQKAVARAHSGLLGWDAGWYTNIAAHGYHAVGLQGLRFFPLLPVTASLVHHITFLPVNAATLVIANGCGLAATMAIYLLARSEFGDAGRARTVAWLFNLVPAAFVTVMGYSDSLLILLAVTCFYCLRHQRWWFAAGLGLLAGTARPIGCLLFLPALCEGARDIRSIGWSQRAQRAVAIVAPVVGLLAYLTWASVEFGSFTRPLTIQTDPSRHGGLTDPAVTLYRDASNLIHGHHVGTDLHLPWVLLAVGLVVVVFRTLPVSYGVFSVAVIAATVSGSNLDSFERYALNAFPLLLGAAVLMQSRRIEIAVLALSAVSMFGYALLAFLGAYVP